MTPEQLKALTPEQQAWHWQQPGRRIRAAAGVGTPAATRPSVNVAAYISLGSGLLGLLVLPIVLSSAAIIAGIAGNATAVRSTGPGGRMGMGGILLGGIGLLILLPRLPPYESTDAPVTKGYVSLWQLLAVG